MARAQGGLIGLGIAVLVAAGVTNLTPLPAKAAASPIAFGTPTILDPVHTAGEPTIQVSPAKDATVYGSAPTGTGKQRSIWEASADGGQTFRLVNTCNPGTVQSGVPRQACVPPDSLTGQTPPPGGGDTDMRLDASGEDYFLDLYALACNRSAKTGADGPDFGATTREGIYGCGTGSSSIVATPQCSPDPTKPVPCRPDGSDRQWLAVFDPRLTGVASPAVDANGLDGKSGPNAGQPIIYQEYNNLQTLQTDPSYWAKSTNGVDYTPANNNDGNVGADGYPSVDQLTGKVFEATDGATAGTLVLNIGTPADAAGDLCFLDDPASVAIGGSNVTCPAHDRTGKDLITVASGLKGSPSELFTVSSMDSGRNLHITFAINGSVSSADGGTTGTSDRQVFTTVAPANNPGGFGGCDTNCWNHFAPPVQISADPSNVNVFPWVAAGSPGRSDSVWYGNSLFIDPSSNSNQRWFVYMSQVVWPLLKDGQTVDVTGTPTINGSPAGSSFSPIQVSPHPNHYNSICLQGTGCILSQGDRNLADFFTVTIDAMGAAEVMYDDTTNGLIQVPSTSVGQNAVDHPGAPIITIARQSAGPSLNGGLSVSGVSNAPVSGMNDPFGQNGDALYPVIGGTNQPAFDFSGNHLDLSTDGKTLTVTMGVADLSAGTIAANAATVTGTAFVQYVTRWQLGNTIYYAMAETPAAGGPFTFYAGAAASYDGCSVSACEPGAVYYPEVGPAVSQISNGKVDCTAKPCTITIPIPVGDVGSPGSDSLLEEVGSYAFASAHNQGSVPTFAAPPHPFIQADDLPLEIDGICCFNFQAAGTPTGGQVPETPWAAVLPVIGAALITTGLVRRRRRRRLEI